jgi:hypothetical protein
VLPFWALMIAFPRAAFTARVIASPWIVAPPLVCYFAVTLPHLPELVAALRAPSPAGMAKVMGQPWASTMYWAYAGGFDLFVGRWVFLDARERRVPHALVAPALFTSIFFGPIGLALYAAGRALVGARRDGGK